MSYTLFIFDLDDTLIMTEKYHYASWLYVLKNQFGQDFFIDYHTYIMNFHTSDQNGIEQYLNSLGIKDIKCISETKTQYLLEHIRNKSFRLELNDGCEKLIHRIIENGIKFVIVSNSPRHLVDEILIQFPLLQNSTKVYSREMFTYKKPNPECYFKVIKDFPNDKMVAFEDSLTGIEALMGVPSIYPVFINNYDYPHYDTIKNRYPLIHHIISFKDILFTLDNGKTP